MELEIMSPAEIEKKSFEIIDGLLTQMGAEPDEETGFITKRVIHTSADTEYAKTMYYSPGSVSRAVEMLKEGASVITDTNMALTGINKNAAKKLGLKLFCFMADEDVAREAGERNVTRAFVSMERGMKLPGRKIFVCGNAPTALISLLEIHKRGEAVDLVIAVPVGFVNVVSSKELIMASDIPCIVNRGRKGGSNIAAAIVNALMYKILNP